LFPQKQKDQQAWTVVMSMLLQAGFLAVLILIPLIYTEALPKASLATLLIAPPPPPPPPPPPAAAPVVHVKPQVHLMDAGKLVAPKVIPKDIKIIKEDAEPDPMGVSGGVQRRSWRPDGRRNRWCDRRSWWSATASQADANQNSSGRRGDCSLTDQ